MDVMVTGCGGLIGAEATAYFIEQGYRVIGIDNDMRAYFFGREASTNNVITRLSKHYGDAFIFHSIDIRDERMMDHLVSRYREQLELLVHTAAQPSHDWAAKEPHTDFDVNARGTLNLLEAVRKYTPWTVFVHCSTSKVYGDNPNRIELRRERGFKRWDPPPKSPYYHGFTRDNLSVDLCLHSLFGASKLAGDLMVQEYGRYFNMPTVCFRPGCLTGPNHKGAELHGFLAYLMKCAVTGAPYTIYGYEGLQVRCNIHARDLVRAFDAFYKNPTEGAVYTIGGGRHNSLSMLQAIDLCEEISGEKIDYTLSDKARIGDHKWWVSDNWEFRKDYPDWNQEYSIERTCREIHSQNVEEWSSGP